MKHRRYWVGGIGVLAVAAAVWAAVGTAGAAPAAKGSAKLTKVTLQLKWVAQAQFAGYYAAKAKGYYKQMGLDVTIKPGGPDIAPEQVIAGGGADVIVDWMAAALAAREKGVKLVNIAQVFTRSGLTLITWKDTGLNTVRKLRGKKVANWLGGRFGDAAAEMGHAGAVRRLLRRQGQGFLRGREPRRHDQAGRPGHRARAGHRRRRR